MCHMRIGPLNTVGGRWLKSGQEYNFLYIFGDMNSMGYFFTFPAHGNPTPWENPKPLGLKSNKKIAHWRNPFFLPSLQDVMDMHDF